MNITFFGTYNTATTPRIQVLIDGLRAHDISVAECNAPLNITTKQRVAILRQPWRVPLLGAKVVGCWWRLARQRRHIPPSQAVIVGHLGQFDIHIARRLFHNQPIILDYMISGSDTARDRGEKGGLKLRLLTWLDNAALAAADMVIVDTEEHRQRLALKYRSKAIVVAVGASNDWFETPRPSPVKDTALKVIFFGNYTPLQGAPIIGAALSGLNVPLEVTMVGNGQDRLKTEQAIHQQATAATLTWLDWLEANELPALVAAHDVCLGIFGTGPKAYRVVPNKLYQGAAVGCALITSDTPPQRRMFENAALFVPPGDANALQSALVQCATSKKDVAELQRAARTRAQQYFSPSSVVEPFLEKLNSVK